MILCLFFIYTQDLILHEQKGRFFTGTVLKVKGGRPADAAYNLLQTQVYIYCKHAFNIFKHTYTLSFGHLDYIIHYSYILYIYVCMFIVDRRAKCDHSPWRWVVTARGRPTHHRHPYGRRCRRL